MEAVGENVTKFKPGDKVFGGLIITLEEDGDTLLTGPVIDQAALHGLLKKVRDLGMPLVSVSPVESGPSTTLGTGQADQPDVK